MQRGETTSQAAGMYSASPWNAMPYQEHLRLLQTSYCCAAQCKALGLGAGSSRPLPVACIYPTNCTSHLVLPGQAWAVCRSELVQTVQKGSVSISAWYSSHCTHTSSPHAFSSCFERQLVLVFNSYTNILVSYRGAFSGNYVALHSK